MGKERQLHFSGEMSPAICGLGSFETKEQGGLRPGEYWASHTNRRTLEGKHVGFVAKSALGRAYRPKERPVEHEPEPVAELTCEEEDFFHSAGMEKRYRVLKAMRGGAALEKAADRYARCGSKAWVWVNKETGDARVSADFCRSRFCDRCASKVARRVRGAIEQLAEGKKLSLLTLTIPHEIGDKLSVLIARLLAWFKQLRRAKMWTQGVRGGASVLETKFNAVGGGWHPHLHIIMDADWVDKVQIADEWFKLTGCRGTRIEAVRSNGGIARYVAKYVTKQFDSSVYAHHERLVEALVAFRGTRAFTTFGDWRGVELVGGEEAPLDGDWKPMAPLADVLRRADRGEAWACGIIQNLGKGQARAHGENKAEGLDEFSTS